jgi:cytochrome c556
MTAFRRFAPLLAFAAGLAMTSAATAQDSPGQTAQKARHEHFKDMGKAFKALNDQAKTDAPDPAVVKASAAKVHLASTQLVSWFTPGSGPGDGVKGDAKPEAFSDRAGFIAAADAFKAQAAKLETVADGPMDLAALRAQARATGGACKACHDKYRVPDTH